MWDTFYTPRKASKEANGFPWELGCFYWGKRHRAISGGADLCTQSPPQLSCSWREQTGLVLLWKENDSAEAFPPPCSGWPGKQRGAGRLTGCQNCPASNGTPRVSGFASWLSAVAFHGRALVSRKQGITEPPGTAVSKEPRTAAG